MAKEMVYFNATKQIETITVHYNDKLDGNFVDDVCKSIQDIAKKMGSKVDLKNPREFYTIQVFVYPDKKMFYSVFGGEIEKRFYSRRRSLEDLCAVRDSEGNIHILSPRGMGKEKRDAIKIVLTKKVLEEFVEEKDKDKIVNEIKKKVKEELEQEEKEQEQDEEELEQEDEELEQDEEELEQEDEELEQDEEELEQEDEELEQEDEKLEQDEVEEVINTEKQIEEIDKKQDSKTIKEQKQWLNIGWFMYVNGKLKKEKDIKQFAEHISKNGVKKLKNLSSNSRLLEKYQFYPEYSCALVEFIITTYGTKKFIEYYSNIKDIKGVFGVPKYIFDNQFKAYIKEKYKSEEQMQNVMTDFELKNIVPNAEIDDKEKLDEKDMFIDKI